ncbi:MAG: hypothetical protein L3K05_05595, partial [Thermoplasmata archaeon]|nr:hypothetical protein [Thermoplasmata archaeon]
MSGPGPIPPQRAGDLVDAASAPAETRRLLTVYALMVFFVAYFVFRGAARMAVERRKKTVGDFDVAVPTTNPLVWLL